MPTRFSIWEILVMESYIGKYRDTIVEKGMGRIINLKNALT